MTVWDNKSDYGYAKCQECGKSVREANLHKIEIGEDQENRARFYLCYSCLKELEHRIKFVRPEGESAWEICEFNSNEPDEADDCLHCRECIISTADGISRCFECLLKGFFFYADEIPEEKRCQKD